MSDKTSKELQTTISKIIRRSVYGLTFQDEAIPSISSIASTKSEAETKVENLLVDIELLKSRVDALEQENKLLRSRADKADAENEE